MQFDVVIPTRGNTHNLKNILSCIALQSLQPQRIIFVVNWFEWTILELQWAVSKDLSADLYKRVIRHIEPLSSKKSWNASFARNIWRSLTQSDYIYFIDDDNQFTPDFFARTVAEYLSQKHDYKTDIVYSPTIIRRHSQTIQSQWIKAYHFLAWRPEPVLFSWWKHKVVSKLRFLFPLPSLYKNTLDYNRVATIWWNSLFSSRKVFEQFPFDETMSFVYEDIDCMYRITKSWIPLIVSKKTSINHIEVDKNKLQQSFLGTAKAAFQKSKNRIIFVKKNATLSQKIAFFCVWLPITSLMTILFIIVRGWSNRIRVLHSYILWIFAWIK